MVSLLVGDHFEEALGLVHGHRATERGEREFADLDVESLLLGLCFGETCGGDLGVGEDGRRDRDPVLRRLVAGDDLGNDDNRVRLP